MTKRSRYIILILLFALVAGVVFWWLNTQRTNHGDLFDELPLQGPDSAMSIDGINSGDRPGGKASTHTEEGTIEGQVVTPDGEPLEGAEVTIQSPGLDEAIRLSTGPGGMFSATELPQRMYAVEASMSGYGPSSAIGVVPGGAQLRLTLTGGKSVTGQILANGSPASHVVIHLGAPGVFPQRSATSNTEGYFTFGGLRAGRYEYIATKPGWGNGFGGSFIIRDDGSMKPESLQINLTKTPSFDVHIVDSSTQKPVEFAVLTFSQRKAHVLSLDELVDGGNITIDYLTPARYYVTVRAPGYLPHGESVWVQPDGRSKTIAISSGARVCGTVKDKADNGIPGANIRAIIQSPTYGRFELQNGIFERFHRLARPDGTPFFWPASSYYSNDDGSYCIGGLPQGEAHIVANAAQYASNASSLLSLKAGQTYTSVDIMLSQGRQLRGRVVNASGDGVFGATLTVTNAELPSWISGQQIQTDRSGGFEFMGIAASVRVDVRHPDYARWEGQIEIPEDGLDDYLIELSDSNKLRIKGRVLTTQKGPAKGAMIWFMQGESSVPVCRGFTDSKGHFDIRGCTTKPERILIKYDGYAPLESQLVNIRQPKDWVLRSGGQISVVSRAKATNITIYPLWTLPEEIWERPTVSLKPWSRKYLKHVPPGDYRMKCNTNGHTIASKDIIVRAGERTEAVCPVAEQLQSFSLYVVDPQGAPVDGAIVQIPELEEGSPWKTNNDGKVTIETKPGQWVTAKAIHARWGEGNLDLQTPDERHEPFRITLNKPIGALSESYLPKILRAWGIQTQRDRRSLVVASVQKNSPGKDIGIRRRDLIMWAETLSDDRLSIGIDRNGELVTFTLVRK